MKRALLTTILLIVGISFSPYVNGQSGVLDQTFGVGGKVLSIDTNGGIYARGAFLQKDGKIVMVGIGIVRRYKSNGVIDSTYGLDGTTTFPISTQSQAMQSDEKIVVIGNISSPSLPDQGHIGTIRLKTNGEYDSSFGTNGIAVISFLDSIYKYDNGRTVLIRPNGKILIGGYTQWGGTRNYYTLSQLNPNGVLDSRFGINGKVMSERVIGVSHAMALQPNGKILVGANYYSSTSFQVRRYNENGSIDSTYGLWGTGTSISPFSGYTSYLQPDGKILFAGTNHNSKAFQIARFDSTGNPDYTFGTAGVSIPITVSGNNNYAFASCIQMQPDGKILAGGSADTSFVIIRLKNNGTVDQTFGKKGKIATHFGYRTEYAYALLVQPDGKLILAGSITGIPTNITGFAIARYGDGEVPSYFYNTIEGIVFLDKNADGIKQVAEPYFDKAKIVTTLPAGLPITTTTSTGRFSVTIDTGNFITTAIPYKPYYTIAPALHNTNESTFFNIDSISFALQPFAGKRDLNINILSDRRPRAGFHLKYTLIYKNDGTDTANGTIELVKSKMLGYNFAIPAPQSILGDTLRWVFNNIKPDEQQSIGIDFTVPSYAIQGDTIQSTATISSSITDLAPLDNTSTITQTVRNSYDPNNKTENHGGKITSTQVAGGECLQYTIRFQNTGNDTAFNVYIHDTLDSKLDWNSLQIVASSHNYKMTMNDGKCLFMFPFIMLVDSIKNEPKSHGYIVYKIKAKPTVQIGNVIKNTAAIYFDYNLPVMTNTETTALVADALPLKLLTFTAKKKDKTNVLNWITANELNVERFEVESCSNPNSSVVTGVRDFSKIGTVKAGQTQYSFTDEKPATGNASFYRLKMLDKDGQFTYSPIRMINNNGGFYVNIYPNPAKDNLQVQIESDKKTALQLIILSGDGKTMQSKNITAAEGFGLQSINISPLPKGSYLLKVNGDNVEQVLKFEKM